MTILKNWHIKSQKWQASWIWRSWIGQINKSTSFMNFLNQIVPETMYYATLWAKPLKIAFPAWLTTAILDIGLSQNFPTFLWGAPHKNRWQIQWETNLCSPQSRNFYRWPNYYLLLKLQSSTFALKFFDAILQDVNKWLESWSLLL